MVCLAAFASAPVLHATQEVAYVDVYYGKALLATSLAEYDEKYIRFTLASEFLDALPDTHEQNAVRRYFEQPIAYIAAADCIPEALSRCFTDGEVVKLVFDPLEFRVQIYLNPNALVLQTLTAQAYLPSAAHALAYVGNLNLLYSANQFSGAELSENYNFSTNQILSSGNRRLQIDAGLSSNTSRPYVRELTFVREYQRERIRAGRYELSGDRLASSALVTGFGVHTTTDMRLDLDQLGATAIELFLPEDCRVDIYKDDRLVASKQYELGNRQLDVSSLPEGAYNIQIRAYARGRLIVDSEQFFVKSTQLPATGESHYGFDFGASQKDDFELRSDGGFMRFEYGHRWRDDGYFSAQTLATPHWRSLQGVYQWFLPSLLGEFGLAVADDGFHAIESAWYFQAPHGGSYSLDWYLSSGADDSAGGDPFRRGSGGLQQWSLRHAIGGQQYFVRSQLRYSDTPLGHSASVALSVDYFPLVHTRDVQLAFSFSQDQDAGFAAHLDVRLSFPASGHRAWLAARAGAGRAGESGASVGVSANTQNILGRDQLRYQLSAEQQGARRSWAGAGHYTGEAFDGSLEMRENRGDVSARSINLGLASNVSASRGGVKVFGGHRQMAGVVIEIGGREGYPVSVIINDRQQINTVSGSSVFVPLQYYRSYTVRVAAKNGAPLELDQGERELVLYPGNIPILRWQGLTVFSAFGQFMQPDLAADAEIEVRSSAGYDRIVNGDYFALEMREGDSLSVFSGGNLLCQLPMPTTRSDDVLDLAEIRCPSRDIQ